MPDISKGTVIKWGTTAIADIASFNGLGLDGEVVDITDLDDSARAFLSAGLYDGGELSAELNHDPDLAIHLALPTDLLSGTTRVLQVIWLNGTSATSDWSCNAYITHFEPGMSVGEKATASVTFKATGTVTL